MIRPGDRVRDLIMRGQRRLHFTGERDSRRHQILDAVLPLTREAVIYDGAAHPRRRQHDACLEALVARTSGDRPSPLAVAPDR